MTAERQTRARERFANPGKDMKRLIYTNLGAAKTRASELAGYGIGDNEKMALAEIFVGCTQIINELGDFRSVKYLISA